MGRPQKAIETRNVAVADFAEELRRLRKRANLTVQELARRAHCSTGSISGAASGRTLPTWEITRAYVTGCDEEPEDWRQRWEAVADTSGRLQPASRVGEETPTGSAIPDNPSLASITIPQDFHRALLAIRVRQGNPSLRHLSILARSEGHTLPRSTLADALRQTSKLPSMEIVEGLLAAYDVAAPERDSWRWAWSRTAYLQQQISQPGSERWQDRCPYPGLAAFDEESAEVFYGRDELTAQLKARVNKTIGGAGMLAVIGPSGAGKSSLLRAGLLPSIANGGPGAYPKLIMTPGTDPLGTLADHLARMAQASTPDTLDELTTIPGHARSVAATAAGKQGTLLIVIDQFEELFVHAAEDMREQFIAALVSMTRPGRTLAEHAPAIVVLGLRSDFYQSCAQYPALIPLLERPFLVGPMTEAELRIAITAPAAKAGLRVEAGLTDVILQDVQSRRGSDNRAGMLPLLAHALRQTWEHRDGNVLTCRAYAGIGGLAGGLAGSAEAAYESLPPTRRAAARALLVQMVSLSADGFQVRRRVPLKPLAVDDDAAAALEAFTTIRLITIDQDVAEITHEALLRVWPRLTSWINEDRARILVEQEIVEDALAWERARRDNAFLYTGSRLLSVRHAVPNLSELPRPAQDFIATATYLEKRRGRRGAFAVLVLSVLTVVSLLLGSVAFIQRNEAMYQRDESQRAQAEVIAAQSEVAAAQSAYKAAQAAQLKLSPITVILQIDSQALLSGSSAAIESVRKQVAEVPELAGQRAGLVLTFVGSTDANAAQSNAITAKIDETLKGSDVFANATFREFFSLGRPRNTVQLEIYLFNVP